MWCTTFKSWWKTSGCNNKKINYYTIFLLVPQPLTLILVFTRGRLLQSLGFFLVSFLILDIPLMFLQLLSLLFVCQVIKAFFIQLLVVFGEKEKRTYYIIHLRLRVVCDKSPNITVSCYFRNSNHVCMFLHITYMISCKLTWNWSHSVEPITWQEGEIKRSTYSILSCDGKRGGKKAQNESSIIIQNLSHMHDL